MGKKEVNTNAATKDLFHVRLSWDRKDQHLGQNAVHFVNKHYVQNLTASVQVSKVTVKTQARGKLFCQTAYVTPEYNEENKSEFDQSLMTWKRGLHRKVIKIFTSVDSNWQITYVELLQM